MLILAMLLILLILPNTLVRTKTSANSYNSKMDKLAEQNLKATTSQERAKTARRYSSLKTQNEKKSGNNEINLVPVKVMLILLMAIFTYTITRLLWVRRLRATENKA